MPRYSSGLHSRAICDRCGFGYKYQEMKKELSGIWVCSSCHDGSFQRLNHPQLKPAAFRPDAPLYHPRPDVTPTPASVSTGGLRYL